MVPFTVTKPVTNRERPKELAPRDTKHSLEESHTTHSRNDGSKLNKLWEVLLKTRDHNEYSVISTNKHAYLLKLHF
jgi:hypothetical protein